MFSRPFNAFKTKIHHAQKHCAMLSTRLESIIKSNLFLKITFAWFILQSLFFALTTKFGLPPDETYHFTYIKLFAEQSPSPILASQGNYFILLEAIKNPFFLYHYLLSFPYLIFNLLPGPYIFLRFINVGLGIASLYMVYIIANQMKISKLARNLSLFMLSNTLMFVFIFSAVSYDTLFIFLSLAGTYLLLQLQQKITAKRLLLFVVLVAAGIFVKINFLPIAALLLILFFVQYAKTVPRVTQSFKRTFSENKKLNILLIVMLGFLLVLFAQRYVGNIVQYGKMVPDCDQVQSFDYCMKNSIFQRTQSLASSNNQEVGVSAVSYILIWSKLMAQRTFGIYAHHIRFPGSNLIVGWVFVMAITGFIYFAKLWKPKDRAVATVAVISLFYLVALIAQNYFQTYKSSFNIELAVHGRYAFSVLPFIFLIIAQYSLKGLRSGLLKFLYIFTTLIIFVFSGLPTYLHRSERTWYNRGTKNIIIHNKN
jgi:hypothetical protein